jgi:hypothetical protein
MPQVIYPSADENGVTRTWDQVFPIWKNDDENTEWRVIDMILEAIAMNSRFGNENVEQMRARLKKTQHDFFAEELAKCVGDPHDYRAEFPDMDRNEIRTALPADRCDLMEKRRVLFTSYGKWMFYIDTVLDNLGGAYREHKQ